MLKWISSFFSFLMLLLRYTPTVIETVRTVLKLIQDTQDAIARKKKAEEIKKAVQKARETQDTSGLEDLFGPGPVTEDGLKPAFSVSVRQISPAKPVLEEKKSPLILEVSGNPHFSISSRDPEPDLDFSTLIPHEEFWGKLEKESPSSQEGGFFAKMFGGRMGGTLNDDDEVYNVNHMHGSPRISSYLIGPLSLLLILFTGCKPEERPLNMPTYKPKVYAGNADMGGVYRKQSGEFISASDPRFNEMAAMSYGTFSCIYETYVNNCKEYKQSQVTCTKLTTKQKKELKAFVKSF
jgi:hypothetical protein